MANLKDLKTRIQSVKSTQKITKAMQMVAASKLRRAQEAAEAARPYAGRMATVLSGLAASVAGQPGMPPLLAGTGREDVHLVIVATSERGLCGGFNSNIVRAAKKRINALQGDGKTVKLLCIGRKGVAQLKSQYGALIVDTVDLSHVKSLAFADVQPIAERVLAMFGDGEFDVCSVFYARFKSALTQIVTEHQLIPAAISGQASGQDDDAGTNDAGNENGGETPPPDLKGSIYEYEPDEEEILQTLLPRNLSVQLFGALLENAASEQGSRMTAMDSATRNASDMIDALSLKYNRTRQAVITSELIEIISGAEAL